MASYTFKWAHPAEEVYVTGTFDNWSKSERMSKIGDGFEKTVSLPDSSEKIYYKFVVDGDWTTNHHDPIEKDPNGNDNNVLTPEAIVAGYSGASATRSGLGANATTLGLAEKVPQEPKKETSTPGAFPETPADELNKSFSVSPLPAADGAVNPIKLAAGEPVPKELSTADTHSNVKLDKESYENSDSLAGIGSLALPAVTNNFIPESSLPIRSAEPATVNSSGAGATTLGLAEKVPQEPKVPEVVRESQEKAGVDPEASAVASEVEEKSALEKELTSKVPEAPAVAEGVAGEGTTKSESDKGYLAAAAATATGLGAAALAGAYAAKDSVVKNAGPAYNSAYNSATTTATGAADKLPDSVKAALPVSVQQSVGAGTKETTLEQISPEVPAEVKESIVEAGTGPEAAANTTAVEEKSAVENELLKHVKSTPAIDEPSAKTASKTEEVKEKAKEVVGAGSSTTTATETKAPATPAKDVTAAPATPAKDTSSSVPLVDAAKSKLQEFKDKPSPTAGGYAAGANAPSVGATTGSATESSTTQTRPTETPSTLADFKNTPSPTAGGYPASGNAAAPPPSEVTKGTSTESTVPAKTPSTLAEFKDTPAPTAGGGASSSTPAPAAAASTSQDASPTSTPTKATIEQKKKNRLSGMFGKVKARLSSKEHGK